MRSCLWQTCSLPPMSPASPTRARKQVVRSADYMPVSRLCIYVVLYLTGLYWVGKIMGSPVFAMVFGGAALALLGGALCVKMHYGGKGSEERPERMVGENSDDLVQRDAPVTATPIVRFGRYFLLGLAVLKAVHALSKAVK